PSFDILQQVPFKIKGLFLLGMNLSQNASFPLFLSYIIVGQYFIIIFIPDFPNLLRTGGGFRLATRKAFSNPILE
ncbi:MAG: hypothetical protein EBZ05_08145, partial [Verrucomicrobia bacterium]|nr:hypothetical protein [Verrucomicrobiota bacterium]